MGHGTTGGIHKTGNRSGRKDCSLLGGGHQQYTEGERNSGSGNALAFSRLVRSSPSFPLACFVCLLGGSDTRMQLRILLGISLRGGVVTIS